MTSDWPAEVQTDFAGDLPKICLEVASGVTRIKATVHKMINAKGGYHFTRYIEEPSERQVASSMWDYTRLMRSRVSANATLQNTALVDYWIVSA